MRLDHRTNRKFTLCFSALALLTGIPWAIAGNAWNPPKPVEYKHAGAAFLTLQGHFYLLLGLLEAGDLKQAQVFLPRIVSQIDVSERECRTLADKIRAEKSVEIKYKTNLAEFKKITAAYSQSGAIPRNDPVWPDVAQAGYSRLSDLCGGTVDAEKMALQPIALSVQNGSEPAPESVWKLMSILETGSKSSRYFTLILHQ